MNRLALCLLMLMGMSSEMHVATAPVNPLPIEAISPNAAVYGPVPALAEQVHALHRQFHQAR